MDNKNITDVKLIVENSNKYFTEIGPKLAREVETSSIKFEMYIDDCNITRPEFPVTINELKDAFFSENPIKVLAMTKLVLMLLNIVLVGYINFYYIYLTYP